MDLTAADSSDDEDVVAVDQAAAAAEHDGRVGSLDVQQQVKQQEAVAAEQQAAAEVQQGQQHVAQQQPATAEQQEQVIQQQQLQALHAVGQAPTAAERLGLLQQRQFAAVSLVREGVPQPQHLQMQPRWWQQQLSGNSTEQAANGAEMTGQVQQKHSTDMELCDTVPVRQPAEQAEYGGGNDQPAAALSRGLQQHIADEQNAPAAPATSAGLKVCKCGSRVRSVDGAGRCCNCSLAHSRSLDSNAAAAVASWARQAEAPLPSSRVELAKGSQLSAAAAAVPALFNNRVSRFKVLAGRPFVDTSRSHAGKLTVGLQYRNVGGNRKVSAKVAAVGHAGHVSSC